ncbi:uncharacterized protein LOC126846877 isoform X2 [Adelges cooleyi]|uniref:uncharacterized protein LOC126846877 isoform X2 n=1 Tax=Adelges cooleyi TaxID=133065 RepID=UPI00217F83C3|nr:uncharacterized protein LOC126846877 isoform X2 [Adelges cooleyi]
MCAPKTIIIVLLYIFTWDVCLNCDDVSAKDSQVYEDFINLFNQIPTLMVSTPPPISDADLRQLLDASASNENKTVNNDWSKISGDFNLKINGLKCTYEYVTMKMLHHLQTTNYNLGARKTILLYRKYTWRMLSVLFLAKTSAPRQLWNISALLTAASRKRLNDQDLLKFKTSNANSRFLEKCVQDNILTSNVLSEISSISSNELTEILVSLQLSDGNEGNMIGIYRYSQEFDVYEFSNALTDCVQLVQTTWKTDYSMIHLFTDFVKNTLMMMTSMLVLHYCSVVRNVWLDNKGKLELPSGLLEQVSESYEHVLGSVNYVSNFLAMENDSFFQSDTHLTLKKNVTRENVDIFSKEVFKLYSIFTKKIGLKYYNNNITIFATKNHIKNMTHLIDFSILLLKYCDNNITKLIGPLNFKIIKYFELSVRNTSGEDI